MDLLRISIYAKYILLLSTNTVRKNISGVLIQRDYQKCQSNLIEELPHVENLFQRECIGIKTIQIP